MCKYCSIKSIEDIESYPDDYKIPTEYGDDLFLIGNCFCFDSSFGEYGPVFAKINFCPMCGRKLNSEIEVQKC